MPASLGAGSQAAAWRARRAPDDAAADQRRPAPSPSADADGGRARRRALGRRGELVEQRVHVREAARPIDRQAPQERGLDAPGDAALERARARAARQHVAAQLEQRRPLERARAVQGLPQRHAEAELVGARIDRLPDHLLGRHVERRPQDRARLGEPDLLRGARAAGGGQAEVHHARAAVARDHHVLRLEVAVDDAGPVRGRKAAPRHQEHGRASRSGCAVCRASQTASVSPSTSSIARNIRPPDEPTS